MTTDPAGFVSAISATLTSEHWTRAQVLIPSPGASATAFTGPDRTVRLVITYVPGEPLVAGLTGHPAGHPSTALWSLTITDPNETQLIAAARAGANDRLRHVVALADRLQKAGWEMEIDDKPSGIMCQIASTHGRTLTRLDGTADTPGGWIIDGEGMYADATDGIPTAVLAALATTPRREPAPHATLNAADRPEPTRKSDT